MLCIKNARLSFPHLFEAAPESQSAGAKLVYSAVFLVPKNSDMAKAIMAEIKNVATAKWGAKADDILKQLYQQDRICLHDGNTKKYDGYANCFYINAKDKARPLVLDRDRTPLVESDGKPYAGCYVNAMVEFWAMDNQYGKRINCCLKGVQFARDGDSFTGGSVASRDDFEDLSVDEIDQALGSNNPVDNFL